jgi:hypothetical protein
MAKRKKSATKRNVQHPRARAKQRTLSDRSILIALVLGGLLVGLSVFVLARQNSGAGSGATDAGPVHVHGLGVNPADDSLLIATHTGTFSVARNEKKAARIGDSRQDTMGFTIAGPNHFLGSGHPDVGEAIERDLPNRLGLIESTDAGRTWRAVSLSGQADFHILRFAGQRMYGYDASNDRLLASRDQGRTWQQLARPAPLLDLAIDPSNASRAVASGEGGLYETRDGGQTWRRIALQIGLLGWPARRALYLVDGEGVVSRSSDNAKRWTPIGNVAGQPAAFLAQTENELYVALHDGTVKQSRDGGRTWSVRSSP